LASSRRLSTWHGSHLLLSAVDPAIDQYLLPSCGALSSKPAARRGCCCRSMGQTDGQTDARPFHRICCVHNAGSVNKDLKYELQACHARCDTLLRLSIAYCPTYMCRLRHSTQICRLFRSRSFQPIAWLGTENLYPKTNLDSKKSKLSKLTQNTQKYKVKLYKKRKKTNPN